MDRRQGDHRWPRGRTGLRQRFMALVRAPGARRLAAERQVLIAMFDADPARRADDARWLPTLDPVFWRTR